MRHLLYYTVGFNPKYIDVLALSIRCVRRKNSHDILVICDESLVSVCEDALNGVANIRVVPCADSTDAMDSSFKKMNIHAYDISKYDKIMYIDSDILVDVDLEYFFNRIHGGKLYAYAENFDVQSHTRKQFSLMSYTEKELGFLVLKKIGVFNAGLFGFEISRDMKTHFETIVAMKDAYEGKYYYEQSFMNVYFNLRNLMDTTLINDSNCQMNFCPKDIITSNRIWERNRWRGKFFHFCVSPDPAIKLAEMKWWMNRFF